MDLIKRAINAYNCPQTKFVSRNVQYDETHFPFKELARNISQPVHSSSLPPSLQLLPQAVTLFPESTSPPIAITRPTNDASSPAAAHSSPVPTLDTGPMPNSAPIPLADALCSVEPIQPTLPLPSDSPQQSPSPTSPLSLDCPPPHSIPPPPRQFLKHLFCLHPTHLLFPLLHSIITLWSRDQKISLESHVNFPISLLIISPPNPNRPLSSKQLIHQLEASYVRRAQCSHSQPYLVSCSCSHPSTRY